MAGTDGDTISRQLQSCFLRLPAELIIAVISHLSNDYAALCSFARTCRLVQPLCEEQIYRTVELQDTTKLEAICNAFARRPPRVEAVHTLHMVYKYDEGLADTAADREALNNGIKDMKSLREWQIESPFDDFKWEKAGAREWVERDMEVFRQALEASSLHQGVPPAQDIGLAKLQKLTIHSHGPASDFWELGGYDCLFRHPALRYLHVSCVTLPADVPELEPFASTTPLQTLVFDECELTPKSLQRILSTPKALKHLTLGENVANIRNSGPSPKLTCAPDATLRALMPLSDSLETLTHHDPTSRLLSRSGNPPTIKLRGEGMRNFDKLRVLDCNRCSFLHQAIILSPALAPPNLETLRLRYHRKEGADGFSHLPNVLPYTYLSGLKSVEIVQPLKVHPRAFRHHACDICKPANLRDRHSAAYKLWQAGINMKVYAEALPGSHNYIPPFLHHEPSPELLAIYDAKLLGFYPGGPRHVRWPNWPYLDSEGSSAEKDSFTADVASRADLESSDELTDEEINHVADQVRDIITNYHYEQCARGGVDPEPPPSRRRPTTVLFNPQTGALILAHPDMSDDEEDGDLIELDVSDDDDADGGWLVDDAMDWVGAEGDDGDGEWEDDDGMDEDEEGDDFHDAHEFMATAGEGALHGMAGPPLGFLNMLQMLQQQAGGDPELGPLNGLHGSGGHQVDDDDSDSMPDLEDVTDDEHGENGGGHANQTAFIDEDPV